MGVNLGDDGRTAATVSSNHRGMEGVLRGACEANRRTLKIRHAFAVKKTRAVPYGFEGRGPERIKRPSVLLCLCGSKRADAGTRGSLS